MVDHLEQRALGALRVQGEDAERDEPELRDGRVADDEPRVGHGEGHDRPVEDRGQADEQEQRLEVRGRVGVDRQDDAQEAVGRHLRQHPREDGQHRQRHRAVAVWHPAV